MSTTIRVSEKARATLHELALLEGTPMAAVVEQAIEQYRRQRLFAAANADYLALRADPAAWRAYQDELAAWDVTLADGLEED
jgi:predicted transcriptional regulator